MVEKAVKFGLDLCFFRSIMRNMKKRSIRVMELEDFMCRCGQNDFEATHEGGRPVRISCRRCGRGYRVRKLEKTTRISNLPMSLGFRSLYWDRIEQNGKGATGIINEGYEISELPPPR
jgi:ribosomal protein S27AE